MQESPIRIAMRSGTRNISTAMMRHLGARVDTAEIDELFYTAYLAQAVLVRPMREEAIAWQSDDLRRGRTDRLRALRQADLIWKQKHMTHHILRTSVAAGRCALDVAVSAMLRVGVTWVAMSK